MFGKNYFSVMVYALIFAVGLNCVTRDAWAQDWGQFNECQVGFSAGLDVCFAQAGSLPCTHTVNQWGGVDTVCNPTLLECYDHVISRTDRCLGDLDAYRDHR